MIKNTRTGQGAIFAAALALVLTACSGSNGKDGANGKDGTNGLPGVPGQACTVVNNGDQTATITCGTTQVTVATGINGINGTNGADGSNGINGTNGINGINGVNGVNGANGADGSNGVNGTNGSNGADGVGCTMVSNGNGTNTITCPGGSVTVAVNAVVDYNTLSAAERADGLFSGLITNVAVSTATSSAGHPVVTVKVSDRKGNGVKGLINFNSTNTDPGAISWRFALLKYVPGMDVLDPVGTPGVNGSVDGTWVGYVANSATATSGTETATAAGLVDNQDGTYTYTFAKALPNIAGATGTTYAGTSYDANAEHKLVVLIYDSSTALGSLGNPFNPINLVKDFVPATGEDITGLKDKVDAASCLECHTRFRALANGTGSFHGGVRYNPQICVACHNDSRRTSATLQPNGLDNVAISAGGTWSTNLSVVNGEAFDNLPVFIHKIHRGEGLTLQGGTYTAIPTPYEIHYPQDIRNCVKCHRNVALAANWKNQISRRACGACHDDVSFKSPAPNARHMHTGGQQTTDQFCGNCHVSGGPALPPDEAHVAVVPPNPNADWAGGADTRTNDAFVAAAGVVPAGATQVQYLLKTVATFTDGSGVVRPALTFKIQVKDTSVATPAWADVNFGTYDAVNNNQLIPGFIGTPAAQIAYSVAQDGVTSPADFNVQTSCAIRVAWINAGNAAVNTCYLTSVTPDASGYYTVILRNAQVPAGAGMYTGGVGYQYSMTARASGGSPTNPGTLPLTQVTFPAGFPALQAYNLSVSGSGTTAIISGGLIVPAPDVWAVGSINGVASTARRVLINQAGCNNCHGALGVAPTFHVGQRNDGPTCAFCHNPNQTSSNWSANAKDFIHAVHAAGVRSQQFTWHEVSPTQGYWQVTYPGRLNACNACHTVGAADFSASASQAALPNMLASTVAVGLASTSAVVSPYVVPGTTYGAAGFAFSQTSGAITPASAGTLVVSPITAACSACHDSTIAIDHMQMNGGTFYGARSTYLTTPEQCLICHGQGKIAAIGDVHNF
jgi:OmcA/MtrC family decaheme c-type cytochrome